MKSNLFSSFFVMAGLMMHGCGASNNSTELKEGSDGASSITTGLFKLYRARDTQPTPNCDLFTELRIEYRNGQAVAALEEKADGVCPITVANLRSYTLFVLESTAAKKVYRDVNINPALDAWNLEIEDYRDSVTANVQNLIVVHEQTSQEGIIDLYSTSSTAGSVSQPGF